MAKQRKVKRVVESDSEVGRQLRWGIQAERLKQLRLQTKRLEEASVSRDFHEECLERVAEVLIKAFEDLPAAVAPQIVGCTPAEAEQMLADRIDAIRRQVASEAAFQKTRTNGATKKRRVGRPLKIDQS